MGATPAATRGRSAFWIGLAALVALAGFVSFRFPGWPLLVVWLAIATLFGGYLALSPSYRGIIDRARNLVTLYAILIVCALLSTMVAARRSTSATHLKFVGAHFENLDTVRIGIGSPNLDFVLAAPSAAELPWTVTLVHSRSGWQILPSADVDQVSVQRNEASSTTSRVLSLLKWKPRHYEVANAALLSGAETTVTVEMPGGIRDTLRLAGEAASPVLHSTTFGAFRLTPVAARLNARTRSELLRGVALSSLDGERRGAPYERFVRIQRLQARDIVNGESTGGGALWSRFIDDALPRILTHAGDRYLVTASLPYTLSGASVARQADRITDSARIEVRQMGTTWQFDAVVRQRRMSAPNGLSLKFVRNPRPLNSPLPSGVSCSPGVACAMLSLRRLPPPIAQIALNDAGLDPERYGLMARLEVTHAGFEVVTARGRDTVDLNARQPTAIAVVPVSSTDSARAQRPTRWVLLAASGSFSDDVPQLAVAAFGLALLLWSVFRMITGDSGSQPEEPSLPNERALAMALNAVLALLLTRLIIGARVKLFAPFEPLGLSTAIGMWMALAVVTLGLLRWRSWAPAILAWMRGWTQGSRSIRRTIASLRKRTPAEDASPSRPGGRVVRWVMLLAGMLLVLLTVPDAVVYGSVCGFAILVCWFGLAWVSAFAGRQFETFEQGSWSVVESIPDESADQPVATLPLASALVLTVAAALTLAWPKIALAVAIGGLMVGYLAIWRRRRHKTSPGGPDRLATGMGILVTMFFLAVLRMGGANGAMAAFAFVILVGLVSVRMGRAVRARFPTGIEPGRWHAPLLLFVPVLLLLPLVKIDMGLLLITAIPICLAALLAVGMDGYRWGLRIGAFVPVVVMVVVLGSKVLFPRVGAVALAGSYPARAAAFDNMQRFFGLDLLPPVREAMARVAARAIATRNQDLAERVLVALNPGPARDLLMPSIEQIWGAGAYAASGPTGAGMGRAVIGGHGVAEAVSYAENSYAVYVLAEHGVLGGVMVLLLYLLFLGGVGFAIIQLPDGETASMRATRALFLMAALLVVVPALYVVLSNLRKVPITGQNMPFLGLNAWSDVTLCAGVIGILVSAALRINSVRV